MADEQLPEKKLAGEDIPAEVLRHVPFDSAEYYRFIPVGVVDGVLEVAMVNPDDIEARDALQFIASKEGMPFKIFVTSEEDFEEALKKYENLPSEIGRALSDFDIKKKSEGGGPDDEEVEGVEIVKDEGEKSPNIVEEAPVTKIVGVILQHAVGGNASDIHIEPLTDKIRVRFRVDGTLHTSLILPQKVTDAVVARIKILTNMKLDEKRKPQDGRFSAKIEGRKVDFRVSTFPTDYGEKIVLRILDPEKKIVDLHSLGFRENHAEKIKEGVVKPYGLILLTGPTGSGKTTSLYSMLNEIDKERLNTVSLEDPIEYDIAGVSQSQVRPEIDYTFASGLRSILRQDPDVIMLGEIRDGETARLAIQASLTGHLVFSTLHTNNAIGVIPRLIDMGIDPYLIPPTLSMVIAQRLAPQIIPEAREELPMEESVRLMIEEQFKDLPEEHRQAIEIPDVINRAKSIPSSSSGTKGRIGVFEIFTMDQELESLVLDNPNEVQIYEFLRQRGFLTLKEDAMLKSFQGLISFEEVNKL